MRRHCGQVLPSHPTLCNWYHVPTNVGVLSPKKATEIGKVNSSQSFIITTAITKGDFKGRQRNQGFRMTRWKV